MKKLFLFVLLLPACAFAQKVNLPTQVRGILPCTNMPALTGDVTTVSGNCTATASPTFALKNGIQQQSYIYSADSGGANAYAVTLSPAPSLVAGSEVCFLAANGNSGASTLAVNGGSAKSIKKNGSSTLGSGDIASGQIVCAIYDGTNFQLTSPPVSGSGTVTTSGSPANHQVALFSASTAVTGAASDSTTTHALFATAGDPAFRAIQSADLPAGLNAFSALTSSTNTTASMVIGSGSSLTTTGTGFLRSPNLVVNLLDAGAICNGSNDDTVAIQAAYASLQGKLGGSIIWPPAGNTCILTGSITLANTQKIHVIGGAVVWQGVPVNATTGTASESSFNATLTTTSGNWPAAFAVNASIKISGCSVAGYNGLGQITSGGAGGTTLSYIVPGTTTGLGAATGCTAAAIPPVFIYDEDISASTEGFRIGAAGASTPIGAAFSIIQNSTFSVASQANVFIANEILGNVTAALNIGFEIAHGSAGNPTNDEHKFIGNNIYNASTAGFVIDFFQSVDIHFDANTCYGITNVTIACVIDTAGAGFDWRGGFTASSSLADFYGFGQTSHPITIDSVGSESSKRLAWISQSNQTQTGSPCPVNLINDRFATNLLAADGHIVQYECPGPMNIIGGSYGQFNTAAGDFLWAPSVTSPIIPYGSIIGVTSSANASQGHPLLSVSATGPPIGNAVSQINNVYESSGQTAVPPTTPDINYTINPTQVMDANSGAAILNTFADCETAGAPTTLATGATTTDTGLNCLPANATIDAVVGRVTTTITAACTGWELGDASTPARFSSNNTTLTATTTTDAAHIGTFNNTGIASATTGIWQAAAAKVRITCAGGNPGAGAIRVTVFYHTTIAPTK